MARRWRSIFGFCAVLLVMDAIAAQLTDVMLDRLLPYEEDREYRTASPIYHHDLRPNVDTIGRWGPNHYPVRTNALGFRSDSVGDVALTSSQPRLLFIGDSFTEGVGVPYEQTFAGRVASAYQEHGVEVLNAGVVSYAPTIYHRKIRYLIETVGLRFDTLAVFIDLSDIGDEAHGYRLDAKGNVIAPTDRESPLITDALEYGQGLERRGRAWLVRNSLIFRFGRAIKKEIQARNRAARAETGELSCGMLNQRWDIEEQAYQEFGKAGLRQAAGAMDRLYRLARQHGIGLIIAVYPWPYNIAGGNIDSRQVTFWRGWAKERGLPFLNLFPLFISGETPEVVIRRDFIRCDNHWNAAGHKRVADFFLARFSGAEALQSAARFNSGD